jgi:pimeloyl-ACP methyl ester carboxylesterase
MSAARSLPLALGGHQIWSDIWIRSGWRVQEYALSPAHRLLDPQDRCVFAGAIEDCLGEAIKKAPASGRRSAVILLHGMGRSRTCMRRMARILEDAGHTVANVGYASLVRPLDNHMSTVACVAAALAADGAEDIHFVGHSLGGLVARSVAAQGTLAGARVGRLVLLASPNQGSVFADRLKNFSIYKALTGACGQSVTTIQATKIAVPDADMLVVAGGNGKRGYNPLLPGDNDGIVAVSETRLGEAETAFQLIRCLHTTTMLHEAAIRAARDFIANGYIC